MEHQITENEETLFFWKIAQVLVMTLSEPWWAKVRQVSRTNHPIDDSVWSYILTKSLKPGTPSHN